MVEPSKNYTSSKIICSVNEIAVICHDDTIEVSVDPNKVHHPEMKKSDMMKEDQVDEAMTNMDTQSDISDGKIEKGGEP